MKGNKVNNKKTYLFMDYVSPALIIIIIIIIINNNNVNININIYWVLLSSKFYQMI